MYGLKTGIDTGAADGDARGERVGRPRPWPGWTGLSPQNKVLPIPPTPSAIDDQVAAYTIPSTNPGSSASMQLDGYAGVAPPGGSINVSYTLNVAHREIAGNNNDISSLQVQIGSCVIPVPVQRSANPAAPVVDDLTSPCLAAAVASNFSVTFTAKAGNNRTFTENLDGINLVVNYTPPVYSRAERLRGRDRRLRDAEHRLEQGGLRDVGHAVRAARLHVSADFKNKSVFEFHRGVIARAIATDAVPPADSSQSFCLGYGSPCLGPARVLKFTATVSGATAARRARAVLRLARRRPHGERALVEPRAIMIAAGSRTFLGRLGKGDGRRMNP